MLGATLDKMIAAVSPAWGERRACARVRYEALAAYSAADRDRSTEDWRPRNVSADSAILESYDLVIARARSISRDTSAGTSILGAFGRNVIGTGIVPAAAAKGPDGTERRDFNERRDWLFNHWASRAKHCDIERKQTFWRKQRMAMEEMVGVGQHFIAWSYVPNKDAVGLRLQSFEPEQLDVVKLVNPDTGNQIRRGIEIDEFGGAVAYWFYPRPLNDYYGFQPSGISGSLFWESKRLPAEQVFHVFDQKRTRQTHGMTWLAPSMKKLRNVDRYDDAALLKAKVEAAIALQVNKLPADPRSGMGQMGQGGLPPRPGFGGGGPASGGPRRYEFEPAMIFEALPGEEVKVIPNTNGGANYEPFINANMRSAAAGVQLSYDVVTRNFDGGSYSSKRQGALEDRREYSCSQDLIIDTVCQPVVELFTTFAVLEGRIQLDPEDEADFWADPATWLETEWLPDGFEWIDPAKEASAASIRLDKRLDTRKAIIGSRGGNWRRVFQQIGDEQAEADRVGITLPDVEPTAPKTAGDAPPPPDQPTPPGDPAGEDDDTKDGDGESTNGKAKP